MVHDFLQDYTSHGLSAVSVIFTGKRFELSTTIKAEPPAEPSFKVKI